MVERMAHDDLAFSADVDDAGAERNGDPCADQQQRHRLERAVGERVPSAEGAFEQLGVALNRVGTQQCEEDRTDQKAQDHGCDRDGRTGQTRQEPTSKRTHE